MKPKSARRAPAPPSSSNRRVGIALSLLRLVAGFLMWQHGMQKLAGWFGGPRFPLFSQLGAAGMIEAIGGGLIFLGLLTRPVALLLAAEMAVAYYLGHAPQGRWPLQNGGIPALQYAMIFLELAAAGPGIIALDSLFPSPAAVAQGFGKLEVLTRTILRVGAAFLFWQYGASKFLGMFGGRAQRPFRLMWVAGVLEFFGAPLIALGLFTRCVTFVFCGEMAVAYWTSHFPRGLWPTQNGGEPAVLFCFIYLYFWAAGAGPISLDSVLKIGSRK